MTETASREFRILAGVARVAAAEAYDVQDVLEGICAEVRSVFGFDRALLVRYRQDDRTVHAVVRQGVDWPGDEWLQLAMFPFLERALHERRTVFIRDARAESAMPSTIIERFGVRSIVAVPLQIEGSCLGFIVADRTTSPLGLDESELDLLTGLGFVAAVLIQKADQHAELQVLLEDLRRLDQTKGDFVSIASHELRTPIAVVHGIASTLHLRGSQLEEDQLVQLRAALYEQTVRLQSLAEKLLDLSRLDSGKVAVRLAPVRPRELVDTLLPRIAPDRLGDVSVGIDPELVVRTDEHALERVVTNLLTNALRYGRPPVTVSASAGDATQVVVEDRGDGVDEAFVPALFERFTRDDTTRAVHRQGAGLGLAIAASYALELGGELRYEAAQPTGARFTLTLPS